MGFLIGTPPITLKTLKLIAMNRAGPALNCIGSIHIAAVTWLKQVLLPIAIILCLHNIIAHDARVGPAPPFNNFPLWLKLALPIDPYY